MVNNAEKSAESYKGRMAQKYGIPIVSTSFVDVSVEKGELVETDDFLAVGKTAAEQFQTGKIIGMISCVYKLLFVVVYVTHFTCSLHTHARVHTHTHMHAHTNMYIHIYMYYCSFTTR